MKWISEIAIKERALTVTKFPGKRKIMRSQKKMIKMVLDGLLWEKYSIMEYANHILYIIRTCYNRERILWLRRGRLYSHWDEFSIPLLTLSFQSLPPAALPGQVGRGEKSQAHCYSASGSPLPNPPHNWQASICWDDDAMPRHPSE